jgi:hypothetical protein
VSRDFADEATCPGVADARAWWERLNEQAADYLPLTAAPPAGDWDGMDEPTRELRVEREAA